MFSDDTSLFSTVKDPNITANQINNDLHNISTWDYQWKMNFNHDTSKQAQEVLFSSKVKVTAHPQLVFNNNPVHETATQKHLGMFLDFKLNFQEHFENMLNKVNKTIGLLRKLQNTLPRPSLLTIYKSFIRPHLDYGDIIYDQACNASFQQKVESIQYNSALAITGAIRGTSKDKLFEELGLESLQHRWWYRKLCYFYKILKDQSPKHFFNIISKLTRPYSTRNANNIPHFKVKHSFFKNTFFPSVIIEWNKLDPEIQNAPSLNIFKKNISKFIRPAKQHIWLP